MKTTRSLNLILLALFSLAFSPCSPCPPWLNSVFAHEGHDHGTAQATSEMATAAKAFFDSLSDEQKKTAGSEFKHDERLNWPVGQGPRKGLPLGQMDDRQREQAKKLLASGMSAKGNDKVWAIISLEHVLKELEQRARPGAGANRDSGLYYWTVFGQPGGKEPWGWRVEGHHVAVNFTIAGEHAAGAP